MKRFLILVGLAMTVIGCAPKPPVLAYMTVGTYSWGCGYDFNGAAVDVERVPELAERYKGPREAAILFRFDPVEENCFQKAHAALRQAGFLQIHVVRRGKPGPSDPALIP